MIKNKQIDKIACNLGVLVVSGQWSVVSIQ